MDFETIRDEADSAFAAQNYETAFRLLRAYADAGHVWAMEQLGVYYWLANPPNAEEAIRLLTVAAEQGSGLAAHNLGVLYSSRAPGVERDFAKFRQWMMVAYESDFEKTVASDPLWWDYDGA